MKTLVLVWLYAIACAALFTWVQSLGVPRKETPVTYYFFDPRPETVTTFEVCALIPQKYDI